MKTAFETCKLTKDKPSIIIAHTIKGKGVSFMEDDNNWHYRIPNPEEPVSYTNLRDQETPEHSGCRGMV